MSRDPGRWHRVKELFQSALARPVEGRSPFLREACGDDEDLRREVTSLLAAHEQAGRFAESAAGGATISALRPESTFGAYRIVHKIGAGGMGEVYRAHDPKLGRDVALKVLPRLTATDADHLARLAREARLLAALNHPHIAMIHGVEESDGTSALVLEFVDGPTLAERLAGGPLRLAEALRIGAEIADALAAAHDCGIVHRDLKPANIKLTAAGAVKVLDFGLAKPLALIGSAVGGVGVATTVEGVLAGTPAYMSPEQARGQAVDKRADIWALGCVLYEMLTGHGAFTGVSITDVLAHVVEREPDWDDLASRAPDGVRRVVRRCLEKNADQRFHDARDVRLDIQEMVTARDAPATRRVAPPAQRWWRVAALILALSALGVVVGLTWTLMKTAPETPVIRAVIQTQPFERRSTPSIVPFRPLQQALALSPDGSRLYMRVQGDGSNRVFVRRIDRLQTEIVEGTEGGGLLISPDGQWLAFQRGSELLKVAVGGGVPVRVCILPDSDSGRVPIWGSSWGDDDSIVFATETGLWQVPAQGGDARRLTTLAAGESGHRLPHLLPGSQALLYTRVRTIFRWDDAQLVVRSLVDGSEKVLVDDAADGRYVSSGHLVFARRGTLMAAPFDPQRLELAGGAAAIVGDIMQSVNRGLDADSGGAQFTTSLNGTLTYATGGISPGYSNTVVSIDRRGVATPVDIPPAQYGALKLHPDGVRLGVTTSSPEGNRVSVYDLTRRTLVPLTTRGENGYRSIWTPDGRAFAFLASPGGGRANVFLRAADGSGEARRLTTSPTGHQPSAWSPDGRYLAFIELDPKTGLDIRVLDTADLSPQSRTILATPARENSPVFSPDGRWLAYTSNDSGTDQLYVQPFPGPGDRVPVATGGEPVWRGGEIFYLVQTGPNVLEVHAAAISTSDGKVSVGARRLLFKGPYVASGVVHGYDVSPDGQRFFFIQRGESLPEPPTQLVMVHNWFDELKRIPRTR